MELNSNYVEKSIENINPIYHLFSFLFLPPGVILILISLTILLLIDEKF